MAALSTTTSPLAKNALLRIASLFDPKPRQNNIVLLIDDPVEDLLQSLSPEVHISLAPHIACYRNVKSSFKTKIDLPCLFMLEPTPDNIKKIASLAEKKFFRSTEVHFTLQVAATDISAISAMKDVKILEPLNIPFVPKLDNLMLMRDREIIRNLKFNGGQFSMPFVNLANKIVTMFCLYSSHPSIYFLLKDPMCVGLGAMISDKLNESSAAGSGANKKDKCLVFSRLFDPFPMFYQSQLYLPAAAEFCLTQEMRLPNTPTKIDSTNTFFFENCHLSMPDVQENYKRQLQKYDKESKQSAATKNGVEERIIKLNQNNAKIKNFEVNGRLIKELARSLNSRNQYQHAMNKTISGEYQQDVQEIIRICRSDTGSPLSLDEKLRLIALYCLNKRGSVPSGELKSICCQCGIPDEKVKLLTNLDTIGLPIGKPPASAMATNINFDQEGAYVPESARLARVVASGSKDPELGSMVDQSVRKSYIAHQKGKFLNINAKHQRAKKPQLYIIFVGGITMYDLVCLSRQNIKDYDIVCISDRQIHSKNFLENFAKETDAQ